MTIHELDGTSNSLTSKVQAWMLKAICEHMSEESTEVLNYDVVFYPMPTDTGWEPSILLYLMLQLVGDIDGTHEGNFTTPYMVTQEFVDAFVASFAQRTAKLRQELRGARERGDEVKVGVAVLDIEG